MGKSYTKEEFIDKCKKLYGDKYDYSKVKYVKSNIKVCVICHEKDENGVEHGEFWVTPNNHLRNRKCPKCKLVNARNRYIKSTEQFIKDAKIIHGDKYDYSKVYYKGAFKLVTIICPIHGEFEQQPHVHLMGCGCKECGKNIISQKNKTSFEEFVKRANNIHNNKFIYPIQEINNQHDKIKIICPIHGEFEQEIQSHLQGCGCSKCSNKIKKTTEIFIKEARKIHGDKYDYSKVDYKTIKDKVCIICPKHGEFWQIAEHHLQGNGCFICKESSLERTIRLFLKENDINFEQQKRFHWLGKQSLDFYLTDYNIAIECQGIQHFSYKENSKIFNKQTYEKCVKLDNIKREKCEKEDVKILYFSNLGITYPYNVFEDKEKLLEEIKKH